MYTGQYECLEIFVRPLKEAASVILKDENGKILEKRELAHIYGEWMKIPVQKETSYSIEEMDAEITFAYLSEREDILEHGICVLDLSKDFKEMSKEEFAKFIDTPYREQYHFSPVINWMNDPNGLCWFKGYYHFFYQLNPFGQEWNNMYWGHAASKDFVHWTHLPVVLGPQEELLDDPSIKGGAFSGSALVQDDEVLFYLTRHIGPREDSDETVEYQTMTRSKDMIHFEEEKEIIREKPVGASFDFRDPKAGKFGDKWYIVLGGCLKGKGSILLYESSDKENWNYKNPLYIEQEKIRTIECPDFFKVDDKYVAMGAWMSHYDEYGRFQQCRLYVGDWDGIQMDVLSEQWTDFGSNSYAAQTFEHDGRRILIGWISDFYGEHVPVAYGAYGSATIPRVLHVKDNHVYAQPIEEIYTLKDEEVYHDTAKEAEIRELPDRYYAKLSFEKTGDFTLLLGEEGEKKIYLVSENGRVEFKMLGVKSENVQLVSSVKECRNAEIFVDGRTVEVYLNDGEDVGTRLFYNSSRKGSFKLQSNEPAQIEIYTMKSIW